MKDYRRKPYFTPTEVADRLMVSPITVRQWAQKKLLKAETTPGGHRRFLRHDVERFARERGLTLQPPDDGSLRILVVDDDRLMAESLSELFKAASEDVEVEVAYDGFDAGRKVLLFEPHVVLLDLVMEGMDGFEVCARLKSDPATKAVRVIAMTGCQTLENSQRIFDAGAEACLSKPFDPDEMLLAVGIQSAGSKRSSA